MDNLARLDWSLLQSVLAVAEAGSLSGAARVTGISQPTLGRQIRAAEAALGVEIFRRHPKGLVPTATGEALLAPMRRMREAAGQAALIAAGEDARPTGRVRITASVIVAHFVLPPIIARLRAQEPGIRIDLVASDDTDNLLFREADIAIRMYRPEQLDMVTRHVTDISIGLFAARSYLDRHGRPRTLEEALALDWVGFDREELMVREMRRMGLDVTRDFFATRCDDQAAYWHLVRAGAGLGFTQTRIGLADPQVEAVFPELELPGLPVWLTAHEAIRRVPRVATVWDALAEGLPEAADLSLS